MSSKLAGDQARKQWLTQTLSQFVVETPMTKKRTPSTQDSTDASFATQPSSAVTPSYVKPAQKKSKYSSIAQQTLSDDDDDIIEITTSPKSTRKYPHSYSVVVDYETPVKMYGMLPMFPGHTHCYTDKSFISLFHKHLITKMGVWRNKVLGMLDDIKAGGNRDKNKHHDVKLWAERSLKTAMTGVNDESNMCVGAMNKQVMMGCVGGVGEFEMAIFIENMVFSDKFELGVCTHPNRESFDLLTTFDGDDEKRQFAFGAGNYYD
jgi:hypothetical protein